MTTNSEHVEWVGLQRVIWTNLIGTQKGWEPVIEDRLSQYCNFFSPYTRWGIEEKTNRLSVRTGYTALNHTHNAAATAAGGRFPEFSGELSQPQILSGPCSVPSWSLGGITHTLSTYTDTMSCLDYMKQDSISEEVQSDSPPWCSSVRLHTGNSRGPTAAGDSDDNTKQTYSRGTPAKANRLMERSWVYTCR